MKTLRVPAASPRKPALAESKPAAGSARRTKLINCGTNRQLSRAELMAEDAAFLARMSGGSRTPKNAVELVREGR